VLGICQQHVQPLALPMRAVSSADHAASKQAAAGVQKPGNLVCVRLVPHGVDSQLIQLAGLLQAGVQAQRHDTELRILHQCRQRLADDGGPPCWWLRLLLGTHRLGRQAAHLQELVQPRTQLGPQSAMEQVEQRALHGAACAGGG